MSAGRVRGRLTRLVSGVGQAWLIVGVTLLLFAGLELGYRGQRAVRALLTPPARLAMDSTQHPYFREPWWPEFRRNMELRRNRFDPYRAHWTRPMSSRYVNIDSLGRRVTPQPRIVGPRRQLFLLGGSTTWGFTARDSATIGAWLADELQRRGIRDVEVVNLAQVAFNSTQEAATLLVELGLGRIPALAVFLDGFNDIALTMKYGEPGHTNAEEGIQQQMDRGGRRGFWRELAGLGRHSALVERLQLLFGLNDPAANARTAATVCGSVAGYYRNLAGIGQSLGREYGFPAVYFLQPHHSLSRKPKTRWEAAIAMPGLVPQCTASIDSALADRRDHDYFSLADLFDHDSTTVFIDSNAHITEAANRRVAARIAEVVAPLLAPGTPP